MPLCTFGDLSICGRQAYPNNAYPPSGKIAYLPRSLITRTRGMIIKDYGVINQLAGGRRRAGRRKQERGGRKAGREEEEGRREEGEVENNNNEEEHN